MKTHFRYTYYKIGVALAIGIIGAGTAASWLLSRPAGQEVQRAWQQRAPQEWIRYALRRLEGHTKLEFVAHPVLHALQRRLEREPPAALPSLGKGQQATALPQPPGNPLQSVAVATPQQLREALMRVPAGTRIEVQPGVYRFNRSLRVGHKGEPGRPIVLSAAQPGTVWLAFTQAEGIVLDKPHWWIENVGMRGACLRHDDCEHAVHVVGAAAFTVIRNNHLEDFNAHIKVNGLRGDWPDHGLLAFNTLTNTRARETARPVVPFDLVGASHWRVADNLVSHFVKRHGNRVSYGMFMKGGGEGGVFERNLVLCSLRDISAPGVRVGLSFGGGGTGAAFCRDGSCAAHEHHGGLAVNNIVAHCNDSGIDIHRATGMQVLHNTLINTSGLATRGAQAQALAQGNLVEGRMVARDGSRLLKRHNTRTQSQEHHHNGDALELAWKNRPDAIEGPNSITTDFHQNDRQGIQTPGAIR
jgi:hypothetical protein